jgi:hypothetical protein
MVRVRNDLMDGAPSGDFLLVVWRPKLAGHAPWHFFDRHHFKEDFGTPSLSKVIFGKGVNGSLVVFMVVVVASSQTV